MKKTNKPNKYGVTKTTHSPEERAKKLSEKWARLSVPSEGSVKFPPHEPKPTLTIEEREQRKLARKIRLTTVGRGGR